MLDLILGHDAAPQLNTSAASLVDEMRLGVNQLKFGFVCDVSLCRDHTLPRTEVTNIFSGTVSRLNKQDKSVESRKRLLSNHLLRHTSDTN